MIMLIDLFVMFMGYNRLIYSYLIQLNPYLFNWIDLGNNLYVCRVVWTPDDN